MNKLKKELEELTVVKIAKGYRDKEKPEFAVHNKDLLKAVMPLLRKINDVYLEKGWKKETKFVSLLDFIEEEIKGEKRRR